MSTFICGIEDVTKIKKLLEENPDSKLVGLSLSSCVKDIAMGFVRIEDVIAIISGTKIKTDDQWYEVKDQYLQYHWQKAEDINIEIILHAIRERIIQPRFWKMVPVSNNMHWILIPGRDFY